MKDKKEQTKGKVILPDEPWKMNKLDIKRDLADMKRHHGIYQKDEVWAVENLLLNAEENMKNYAVKEHAGQHLEKYNSILEASIYYAVNQRDKNLLEKYKLIIGTYALISHIESPLYYLENVDLYSYDPQELADLGEVTSTLPVAYLPMACSILTLPSIHDRLIECARVNQVTPVEEMQKFAFELMETVNQYREVRKDETNSWVLRVHHEVESLLDITSAQGYTFISADNMGDLPWLNCEDKPNCLSLVNRLLMQHEMALDHPKENIDQKSKQKVLK